MVGAVWQYAEALREFGFDEARGPIGREISDVEIDVMYLDFRM